MALDFKVEAVIERREIYTIINGRKYVYIIDGAKYQRFEDMLYHSPGKALNYLKEIAKEYRRL